MPTYGLLPNNCFLNNDYSLSRLYGFFYRTPRVNPEKWFNILHDILTNLVQRQSGYCFKKRFIFSKKNYRGIIRDLLRFTVNSMFCTKLKIRIYYSSRFSQAGPHWTDFLSWNNRHVSNYDVVLFILIFLSDTHLSRFVPFLLSQRTFLPRNWEKYHFRTRNFVEITGMIIGYPG